MTLGGLALAIGILVDEATVEIENIHVQMALTPSLAAAVLRGNNITAVPRLLALLCILSVFIPAFIMAEPVRSLFVPLALAVGFAMISSYLLSSTVVPVLSVWLLKHHGAHETRSQEAGRSRKAQTAVPVFDFRKDRRTDHGGVEPEIRPRPGALWAGGRSSVRCAAGGAGVSGPPPWC